MRVSYEWLKSMVDVPADPAELVAEFTRTGTEVEAVEKVGANLEHVVTAQVVSKKPHPDSDHMWLCRVSVGDKNVDEDGNPVLAGFDPALAQYLADFMGLECEIIAMDFDGVLNELAMKTVDIGMAGLSPDPAREGAMAFSDLYYLGGQSFVTTQDKIDQFPSLDVLKEHPEYQIGAQNGSIQADLANEYCDPNSVVILTKVTDIVAELVNGGLDGAFIETAVAENYAITNPDLAVVLDVPYDQAGSAVGVQLDNPVLLELVNRGIAAAIEDGSMDKFVAEANELSTGETYEGLLDEHGSIPDAGTAAGDVDPAA